MPPPGGFSTISFERTFAKPFMRQGFWLAILVGLSVSGPFYVKEFKKRYRVLKIEQTEHFIAVQPFLIAEQERKFLRHLRILREEERELMKDHPGWKLGTLYGEPIFKTLPENALPPVNPTDWMAHTPEWKWFNHVVLPDQHQ